MHSSKQKAGGLSYSHVQHKEQNMSQVHVYCWPISYIREETRHAKQ